MSLKTRILLSRGGRDQFGDVDDDAIFYTSAGLSANEKKAFHDAVSAFFEAQWPAWERYCLGKTSKQIWEALFIHRKPAFSTWEKKRRAFISLSEFLKYVLVEYRWPALIALRGTHAAAAKVINKYEALSRYALEPQIGIRKPNR